MWKYSFISLVLSIAQTAPVSGEILIENGSLTHGSSDGYYYDGLLGVEPYDVGNVEWSGLTSPIRYMAYITYYYSFIDRADCFPGRFCDYQSWEEMGYHDATATFSLSSAEVFQVTPDPVGNLGLQISNTQTGVVLHNGAMNALQQLFFCRQELGALRFQISMQALPPMIQPAILTQTPVHMITRHTSRTMRQDGSK